MRNDSVESAGSVEYSTGGNTECGRTSCGADDWDPHADDFLHVTTGKQARAAAMRAVRKVQSIPESDLADRCCLTEYVCVLWRASRIPKTATAVSKGGALAESSQGGGPGRRRV